MKESIRPGMSISVAVVKAVSAVENCDPTSLPLLRDVVDPEALDALCRSDGDHVVSFEFSDSYVTIESGESIVVKPRKALAEISQ